jgi:neutral ceramidase
MKVGTAMRRITPPIGTPMGGFAFRQHGSEGIRDDLFVRCLWLEDPSGFRIVILALDICTLDFNTVEQWKQEMHRRWGLLPEQILINTSHTHSGPVAGRRIYLPEEPAESYMDVLRKRVMEAVDEAAYLEDQCSMYFGRCEISIGVSRRAPEGQGVKWAPNPGGHIERGLSVLTLKDRFDQPICIIFSVAAHPSIMQDYFITSEFPGAACRRLTQKIGGRCMPMFLQGAAGDVKTVINVDFQNNSWIKGTYQHVERTGSVIAEAVLQVLAERSKPIANSCKSASVWAELPLGLPADPADYPQFYRDYPRFAPNAPVDKWADYWLNRFRQEGRLPKTVSCPVQVLRFGEDTDFIAFGGELTSGLTKQIKAALPQTTNAAFLGYSNGMIGYLPTEQMVREGGYESVEAIVYSRRLPAPYGAGLEQSLIDAVAACLRFDTVTQVQQGA